MLLTLCICAFVFVFLCIWHVWVSLYDMATRPCAFVNLCIWHVWVSLYVVALGLVFVYLCIWYVWVSLYVTALGLCVCVFVLVYLCIWHVWVSLYVMATRPCASCQSICPLTQSWSQLLGTTWRRCLFRDLYFSSVKTTLICDGLEFCALIILLGFVSCKGRRVEWRHRTHIISKC